MDIIEGRECIDDFFSCFDGVIGKFSLVKGYCSVSGSHFFSAVELYAEAARAVLDRILESQLCLLDLRSSNAKTHPFQSFISLSVSRSACGAHIALM